MASFLSPGQSAMILALNERAFATALALQSPPRLITFDRNGVPVTPAQEVLIVWAGRQPRGSTSEAIDVQQYDGVVQKWATLNAQPEDRFVIEGRVAEIVEPVRVIDGIAQAGFRWTAGRS